MPEEQQPQDNRSPEEQAKDPNHPAHPEHKHHGEWLKSAPKKFGNAAIFGAGATAGADAIKGALGQ